MAGKKKSQAIKLVGVPWTFKIVSNCFYWQLNCYSELNNDLEGKKLVGKVDVKRTLGTGNSLKQHQKKILGTFRQHSTFLKKKIYKFA